MKRILLVTTVSAAVAVSALFVVERIHLQNLQAEAQAVLDYGTAAALTSGSTRAADEIRARLPGIVERVEVLGPSCGPTVIARS